MKKAMMFKMPKATRHFNANQRVWVVSLSGAQAAKVAGKFRGSGRYIEAWVKWDKAHDMPPDIKEIEVEDSFYETHNLQSSTLSGKSET